MGCSESTGRKEARTFGALMTLGLTLGSSARISVMLFVFALHIPVIEPDHDSNHGQKAVWVIPPGVVI